MQDFLCKRIEMVSNLEQCQCAAPSKIYIEHHEHYIT